MEIPIVCLSHLRWQFVFQRPQHLMTRFARKRRVLFIEEPVFDGPSGRLDISTHDGVQVVVPKLNRGAEGQDDRDLQRQLLGSFLERENISSPLFWFYTPMALPIVQPMIAGSAAVVYDCMDELSGFQGAPPEMRSAERDLLAVTDVAFTGGHSLYRAKRDLHPNMHAFPSCVDVRHFAQAHETAEPADQWIIPRPRVGFCGVIDERMDLDLVRRAALALPTLQFVMIGPVAKIDPASLPQLPNIHYLGARPYSQLPAYFGGWNVAILPFAHNAATRFISPTKTPEYLAAGLPVVSTSIADVVRPYGVNGFVRIADSPDAFSRAIQQSLHPDARNAVVRAQHWIRQRSWDRTFREMEALVDAAIARRIARQQRRPRVAAASWPIPAATA